MKNLFLRSSFRQGAHGYSTCFVSKHCNMITYIYHSCFVLRGPDFLVVYDYWKDPEGLLHSMLEESRRERWAVYFVVSHFHEDHFNPEVVELCRNCEEWHLLPSYDTVKRRRLDPSEALAILRFGEQVETPHFTLHAYRSTDVGVCTVVVLKDGTKVFHAGDCNNWYFPQADNDHVKVSPDQMEKLFLSILRDIRAEHPRLHHAMFPIDPRLGQEMLRGALQLMKAIDVGHLYPMHYRIGE